MALRAGAAETGTRCLDGPWLVHIAHAINKVRRPAEHDPVLPKPFHLIATDRGVAIPIAERNCIAPELIERTALHGASERAVHMHCGTFVDRIVAATGDRVGLHVGGAGVTDGQTDDGDTWDLGFGVCRRNVSSEAASSHFIRTGYAILMAKQGV